MTKKVEYTNPNQDYPQAPVKWVNARTKDGLEIQGTFEILQGAAAVNFFRKPDGTIGYDFAGGTEIFWDASLTKKNDQGVELFIDEDGNEVAFDELVFDDEETNE